MKKTNLKRGFSSQLSKINVLHEKRNRKAFSNSFICLTVFLSLLVFGITPGSFAQKNHEPVIKEGYKDKAHILVKKMIDAHGGLERWQEAPSFSFISEVYGFSLPSASGNTTGYADIYKYQTFIKPANSTGYALFTKNSDPRIFFDCTDIGSVGLDEGNHNLGKSPAVLLFSAYTLINIPWLTQVEDVELSYSGQGILPLEAGQYDIVKMTFGDILHEGYYELFIDPESGLLKGIKQTAIFPKLPGTSFDRGVSSLPDPLVHVFKSYSDNEELTIPASFVTYLNDKLLSVHFIENPSFRRELDRSLIGGSKELTLNNGH